MVNFRCAAMLKIDHSSLSVLQSEEYNSLWLLQICYYPLLYVMGVLKIRWRFLVFFVTLLMQVLDFSHILFSLDTWIIRTGCSSVIAHGEACLKWVKIHFKYQCWPVWYFSCDQKSSWNMLASVLEILSSKVLVFHL